MEKGTEGRPSFWGSPSASLFFFKLGWTYLGFKRKAKKAGNLFKKQLLADGVDKAAAETLTDQYLRSSEFLSEMIRTQGHRV